MVVRTELKVPKKLSLESNVRQTSAKRLQCNTILTVILLLMYEEFLSI